MLFDSPIYFLALLAITLLYWQLTHPRQNQLLLVFSYVFYAWWDWRFVGLLAISTAVDYLCALAITNPKFSHHRKTALVISVSMNLVFLGTFKYLNFFIDSMATLLATLGIDVDRHVLSILLPPGISFYTFQAISYMVDVYKGRIPPSRSPVDYALFISFFPHLVAGPIQQPSHLLPQVASPRNFDRARVSEGLLLIVSGLFRKCVIADQCALIANAAFRGELGHASLFTVLVGTYAFAWQIYGDFSGYSNIARGSAQLLGFHFPINFRQPYFSDSIQDFWRRWHISLGNWLRDYLYIPLGGNQKGPIRTYVNLVITMVLGGLWHGANLTFLIWGLMHGCWLAIERRLNASSSGSGSPRRPSLLASLARKVFVFHLVCLAWVFFRADSAHAALQFLAGLLQGGSFKAIQPFAILIAVMGSALLCLDLLEAWRKEEVLATRASWPVQCAVIVGFMSLIFLFSANATSAFIYFQF